MDGRNCGRRIGRRIKSQLSKQRRHYQELGNVVFEQSILRPNQRPILRPVFLRPGEFLNDNQ